MVNLQNKKINYYEIFTTIPGFIDSIGGFLC